MRLVKIRENVRVGVGSLYFRVLILSGSKQHKSLHKNFHPLWYLYGEEVIRKAHTKCL